MRDTRQETSTTFKTTMIPFKRLASFAAFCMVLTCPGRVAALGIAPSLSSLRSTLPSERRQRHHTLLALVTTDSHGSATSSTTTARSRACPHLIYTHLEVNGMLWQIPATQNLSLLIDPIAGQLDFGIAPLYTARKKYLTEQSQFYNLIAQAAPTHVLLTQGLDDHTHLPTLRELVKRHAHLHFIIPASAEKKVWGTLPHDRVTVLRHGETFHLNDQARVTATVGSLVGPPWQERENGYLLELSSLQDSNDDDKETTTSSCTIYYEPHGDTSPDLLRRNGVRADVCILPVTQQSLPAPLPAQVQFPLVHGAARMRAIVETLGAHTVVPLGNGDLDTAGPLAQLVTSSGTVEEFAASLAPSSNVQVPRPTPGQALTIDLTR